MATWTSEELSKINAADELHIASVKSDGTLRKATIIWVVRVGDDLYVRSVHGRESAWFRGVLVKHEGRISAGGVEKDVTFVEVADKAINDQIDAAYNAKYKHYGAQYVNSTLSDLAHSATIRLVPRS
jgi:hypothetical protein